MNTTNLTDRNRELLVMVIDGAIMALQLARQVLASGGASSAGRPGGAPRRLPK